MKEIKFVILKSNGCNCYWSYMGPVKSGRIISDIFNDRFLGVDVKNAVMFNTYEEAENTLELFGMQSGIFKIEKIYLINFKVGQKV